MLNNNSSLIIIAKGLKAPEMFVFPIETKDNVLTYVPELPFRTLDPLRTPTEWISWQRLQMREK